jgi:hypothetical protein
MPSAKARALCAGIAVAVSVGCSSDEVESDDGDADGAAGAVSYDPVPVAGSACGAVSQHRPNEGQTHVAVCSKVEFDSNPPSSGNHYGSWAAFGVYEFALPRGYWVHDLEHGAVVISHACEGDCSGDIAAAEDLVADVSVDAFCLKQGLARPRLIMTPDPLLDTAWAASAWGITLRSECFERDVFEDFYFAHVGRGPENICSEGVELRDLDAGSGSLVPPGCGSGDGGTADAGDASSEAGDAGDAAKN